MKTFFSALGIAFFLAVLSFAHTEVWDGRLDDIDGSLRLVEGDLKYGRRLSGGRSYRRIYGPGFNFNQYPTGDMYWRISLWWLMLPCFILLIRANAQRNAAIERNERRAAGQCLNCGYDLRGSTGACPECGTARPT
jgi:hypothetical protein